MSKTRVFTSEPPGSGWGVRGAARSSGPPGATSVFTGIPLPASARWQAWARSPVPESSRPERAEARSARGERRASRTREPSPWALPAGARGRVRRPGRGRRTSVGAPRRRAPGRSPRGRGPSPKRGRGGPAAISDVFLRDCSNRSAFGETATAASAQPVAVARAARFPERDRPRTPRREARGRSQAQAASTSRGKPFGDVWSDGESRCARRPSTPTRRARAGRGRASRSPGRRARRRARPPRAVRGRRRGGGGRRGQTRRPGEGFHVATSFTPSLDGNVTSNGSCGRGDLGDRGRPSSSSASSSWRPRRARRRRRQDRTTQGQDGSHEGRTRHHAGAHGKAGAGEPGTGRGRNISHVSVPHPAALPAPPLPDDLPGAILRLKEERDALILAHYYQESEIQDLADFVGDSLELARKGKESPVRSSPSAASTSWPRRRRS